MEEIIQLIVNNGVGIGVAVYFLLKDWKQSEQRLEADKLRIETDAAQTEVLRELTNTVISLKELITRFHKNDL